MTENHPPAAPGRLPMIWQIGGVGYLAVVMYNFFTGMLQKPLFAVAFSYRPEDTGAMLNQVFSLIIILVPAFMLRAALHKQPISIIEYVRQFWQEYPLQALELVPFMWLLGAALIRHSLVLVLLLPLPSPTLIETIIFLLQISVLVVWLICLLIGFVWVALRRRKPTV